jgi:2-(1,2-epoxy-1,2-dihydrophenyl)acetyl-CoA isomerase
MILEDSTDQPVQYDVVDGIATITLARPAAMNSLDTPTKDALLAAVRRAAYDPKVRCTVLTGTGRAFCVGQDLREHATSLETQPLEEVWSTVERHFSPIANTIATMDKPVIAAVNGVAAGAGMSLALLCDLRIAADTASFNTAFTGIGLSCDTGCSWTLPRLVGPTKAMEMLLMPRSVDAATALDIGLVNSVVPADELAAETSRVATLLANGATLAFGAVKRSMAFSATHSLVESLGFEARMMARTGATADHHNAVKAFLAKEKPVFEGS